jgi:AAA+ superfamily predicted ATPase
MFKKYTKQLFFYSLLLSSGAAYSAADGSVDKYGSSSSWGKQPQGVLDKGDFFEERERLYSGHKKKEEGKKEEEIKELPKPKRIISDEEFVAMAEQYRIDLPPILEATRTVDRIGKQHPKLGRLIKRIKNPYEENIPSRLLFVGPSGCGKTHAAMSIASYCNAHCFFIKGSGVGNTYQNSGPAFINKLFISLLERPEKFFIVIIDEFMTVAKYDNDSKNEQQNKTAISVWQALDDCARNQNQHVCVIGTDNEDPEKFSEQLKSRFAHKIFTFQHMKQNDIVEVMKECLGYYTTTVAAKDRCSDEFLAQLAKSVEHHSIRDIEDLIKESQSYAREESEDGSAVVKEQHLKFIFDEYRDPTWTEKVWMDREKHISNLTSARAASLYMLVGGLGLSYQDYRYGGALMALGGFVNAYWAEGKDLQLFGLINHLSAQHQSSRQWEISHTFNVENSKEAKDARIEDAKKSDKHLQYAESAEARGIRQEEKSDERYEYDKELRLKESLKQVESDLNHINKEDSSANQATVHKALMSHKTYVQGELKKIQSEKDVVKGK